MAQLFKNKTLKAELKDYVVPDFDKKLTIVQSWHEAYKNGSLHSKTETQCEQAFNQSFFMEVLGYQSFPNETYTIDPKASTETGGQKPDAILGYFSGSIKHVVAVVEIKDVNTSLSKSQQREGNLSPIQQAFKYKPQFKECSFVIATNFFELRLHRDNQLDFEQFTLDALLNPEDDFFVFKKFYYLLSAENFVTRTGPTNTERILAEIRIEQEEINKSFYKEYRKLRQELIRDIVKNNTLQRSTFHLAIEKAQKIIDRIVFICFCEDLGLIPENKLQEVIYHTEKLGLTIPVWDILKGFFTAIDKGSDKLGIPNGYNGELFKEDAELNSFKIGDAICKKFTDFGKYDFTEDLSVNILGHIFEQSISDIEELRNVATTEEMDEKISKRKKDGIFYTPDYIVDFIVANTLGKYLEEMESEVLAKHKLKVDIKDENYSKRVQQAYIEYWDKLKGVRVLDPACGSGAFLVKVFDFLLEEYKRVGEILGLNSRVADFTNVYKNILQKNIYGVDLNSESVEISKLSLWLKTARKGERLETLKENIKCGNSLIDEVSIDSRAFNWREEFKSIVDAGGFDVIVGNPPYVGEKGNKEIFQAIHRGEFGSRFYRRKMDLFYFFFHRGIDLLKNGGRLGFITTNYFITAEGAANLRRDLKERTIIENMVNFGDLKIFEDAKGQHNIISILQKINNPLQEANIADVRGKNISVPEVLSIISVPQDGVNVRRVKQKDLYDGEEDYIRIAGISKEGDNLENVLLDKIQKNGKLLENMCNINMGVQSGADFVSNTLLNRAIEKGFIDQKYLEENSIEAGEGIYVVGQKYFEDLPPSEKEILKPFIKNSDIEHYYVPSRFNAYYIYADSQVDINNYPTIKRHLLKYRPILKAREQVGEDEKSWYWIRGSKRKYLINSGEHIVCPYRSKRNIFALTNGNVIGAGDVYYITKKSEEISLKYVLTILNSSLCFFWLKNRGKKKGDVLELYQQPLSEIPIKEIGSNDQEPFIRHADTMIKISREFNEKVEKSIQLMRAEYGIEQWPAKLQFFWRLSFEEFLKILNPRNTSLQRKQELMEYFEKKKAELSLSESAIGQLKGEIDELVFNLYGVTQIERELIFKN